MKKYFCRNLSALLQNQRVYRDIMHHAGNVFLTWTLLSPAEQFYWGGVAGTLPGGKRSWGVGRQQAEHEPAVCPGGQEGQ